MQLLWFISTVVHVSVRASPGFPSILQSCAFLLKMLLKAGIVEEFAMSEGVVEQFLVSALVWVTELSELLALSCRSVQQLSFLDVYCSWTGPRILLSALAIILLAD